MEKRHQDDTFEVPSQWIMLPWNTNHLTWYMTRFKWFSFAGNGYCLIPFCSQRCCQTFISIESNGTSCSRIDTFKGNAWNFFREGPDHFIHSAALFFLIFMMKCNYVITEERCFIPVVSALSVMLVGVFECVRVCLCCVWHTTRNFRRAKFSNEFIFSILIKNKTRSSHSHDSMLLLMMAMLMKMMGRLLLLQQC